MRKIFDLTSEETQLIEDYRIHHGLRSHNAAVKHMILNCPTEPMPGVLGAPVGEVAQNTTLMGAVHLGPPKVPPGSMLKKR